MSPGPPEEGHYSQPAPKEKEHFPVGSSKIAVAHLKAGGEVPRVKSAQRKRSGKEQGSPGQDTRPAPLFF